MPESIESDQLELSAKVPSKWGKALTGIIGLLLGGMGGGAAGTWIAPQASAQAIEQAAERAAKAAAKEAATSAASVAAREAVENERRVTEERFRTVDAKLDAQQKSLNRLEGQVDKIYDAVRR